MKALSWIRRLLPLRVRLWLQRRADLARRDDAHALSRPARQERRPELDEPAVDDSPAYDRFSGIREAVRAKHAGRQGRA